MQHGKMKQSVHLMGDPVFIPAGPAWIGADYPGEGPAIFAQIPAFFIDRFTVSNRQFAAFIEDGGYRHAPWWDAEGYAWVQRNSIDAPAFWHDPLFNSPDQPVTGISYYEASAYVAWAGVRLPTEAEWEKAARGCDGRLYPWGDRDIDLTLANYAPDFVPVNVAPVPVHNFPDNQSPYGCQQMAGNVFEWCSDYFHADTPLRRAEYLIEQRVSPRRVLKGGAWHTGASRLRASARWSFGPDFRDNVVGLRIAHSVI